MVCPPPWLVLGNEGIVENLDEKYHHDPEAMREK